MLSNKKDRVDCSARIKLEAVSNRFERSSLRLHIFPSGTLQVENLIRGENTSYENRVSNRFDIAAPICLGDQDRRSIDATN